MFGLLAILAQSVSAQTQRITPAGDGSFSNGATFAANGWTESNSANNPWIVGIVPTGAPFDGNSAYPSNAPPAFTYTNTTSATNYFYRDVTVPAGESIILVSFDWQGAGEGSGWDNVQVWAAPTSVIPAAATTHPGTPDANVPVGITGATFVVRSPNTGTVSSGNVIGLVPPSFAGTTFRLIFSWKNDGSLGGPTPVAVDNISLTSQVPNPLCGVYTIDNTQPTAGANFNSFTAAINRLNFDGICGPVTFNVIAGQTFNENTPTINVTGTPTNTITFQRSGPGANPVIVPTGGTGTADAGITLAGGDNFTFNGIDIDASAVNTVEYGYLIRNRDALDGARFNVFENFTVTLNRTNTNSRGVLQTSGFAGAGFTPTGEPGTNSSNTYRNFNIRNCYGGLWMNAGSTLWPDDGTVITTTACGTFNSIGDPNVVGDIGTATAIGTYGIQMSSQQGFTIANTQISNVTNTTSQLDGINVLTFSGTCTINNNIINGVRGTGSSTLAMAGLRITHNTSSGLAAPVMRVYNNTIANITRAYTGLASAARGPRGIFLPSTSALVPPVYEIWNNTVTIDGSANPLLSNAVFETTNPVTGANLTIRNNIFANFTSAQGATARHYGFVHTFSATVIGNTATVVSNNDIFIANDLGVSGFTALSLSTNRNGVAAWQLAVSQASGNLQVNPVLAGNLSSGAAGLDATGFSPVPAYISTDILCAARQNDIGAYNINACAGAVAGTITGSGTLCDLATGSLNLTGSSTGLGISFQWKYSLTPGGPYDTNLGTATSQDISALPVGTYYLVVDVTCSSGPVTATTPEFTLVVNPNPTATAGAVDAVLCVGETLNLTGATDLGTSFAWTGPNGFTSTGQNPTLSNVTLGASGNYSLVASASGCPSPASVVAVSVNPNPTFASVTATPNPICANGNSQLNALATIQVDGNQMPFTTSTGNTLADMTSATQAIGTGNDDTPTSNLPIGFTFTFNGVDHTQFAVSPDGWVRLGAGAASNQFANQVTSTTNIPKMYPYWDDLATGTTGNVLYRVAGTAPNRILQVQWFVTIPRNTLGPANSTFQLWLYETSNTIEFRYGTMGAGSMSASGGLTVGATNYQSITFASNSVSSITANDLNAGQPENGRLYSFQGGSVSNYTWSPASFLNDANIAAPLASGVTATTPYTVTATSAAGCTVQQSITVTVGDALSAATIAPVAPEYCTGSSVLLTAAPVNGGAPFTYQWTDPNNNPAGTNATQAANLPGVWTVTVGDACGATPVTASVTVVEKPTPAVSASAGLACLGGTLQLTGTNDIGTSFNWTGPNAFSSTSQNPTVGPLVAASAGTYTFTATLNGCTSAPATVVVAVNNAPTILSTTATPNPVCTGNDAQLNVAVQTGSYCVSGVGPSNTADTDILNITLVGATTTINNNSPCTDVFVANYTAQSADVIAGNTYTLTGNFGTCGGTFPASAQAWIDWNQNGTFEPTESIGQAGPASPIGIANMTFTAPLSALNGATRLRVMHWEGGVLPLNPCGAFTWGAVEDYTVIVTGGVSGSTTYAWTPNTFLNDPTLANPVADNPTTTTAYSVLVTGTNGCTSTGNVTLTVNQSPNVALAVVDNCIASQFSISVNVNSTGNGPSVNLSYTVNGGAPIVVSGLGVGPQTPLGPFQQLDEVVISIVDPSAGCNSTLPVFRSSCPELVVCPNVLSKTYCYGNNDVRSWVFTTTTIGETVQLDFVSGAMAPNDVIRIYDGTDATGLSLVSGNFADLSNVLATSLGESIYLEVESDASGSCVDGDPLASAWVFEVQCNPSCVDPVAIVTPVPDCFNQTFSIDVDVFDLGDASTVGVEYAVNGGQPDTIPGQGFGIVNIGPFSLGNAVAIRILHEDNATCNANLGVVTLNNSACPNDEPCAANILTMNANYTCTVTTTGNMTPATLTAGITGGCTGVVQDQWYRFTATAPTHRVQLGGTTTGLSHSVYQGTCGSLTLVAGTACTAGATASNPANLTIGQIYYVRVSRTAVGTNAYTVCVSAPPLIDVDATVLAEPLATGCYTAAEDVIVTVLNNAIYPLDLSVNPLTVTVNVTGATTATLTGTLNTGVVAPAATVNVTMSTTLNMSVAGAYTFNGSASVTGDGNATNDAMTAATRTVVAATALPISQNFTGFTGGNLATLAAPNNGWREGAGVTPAGTFSAWTSSATTQQTQLGSGVSARLNFSTLARNEWIVSPKIVPVVGTQLAYSIAITDFGSGAVDAAGMEPGDQVIVKVSTDCGVTWNGIALHSEANTGAVSNSLVAQLVDLSAYAGQELIVAFHGTKPSTGTHPSIDFHIDNITIQNVVVCSGIPVAGTAAISNAGPACVPASMGLSISGQSTAGGVVVTWLSSSTPGGPYTAVAGSGTNVALTGITSTTYYVASVKCLITQDSVLTNQVAIQTTPTPTASASAGPACTGQDLQLTGTTDIGTSFSWTGPNGFTSTAQNPVVPAITTAAGGTYTFTATANGCPTSGTVSVSVNNTPVITSVTGTPNPVCLNGNSQLNANVSLAGPVTTYAFGSTLGTFNSIFGAPGTVVINTGSDDTSFGPYALGFTFNYGGANFTTAGVNANGFVAMGALPTSSYTSLSSGATNNVIAAFNADLEGDPLNGGTMLYQVSGAPGSQVFTFEWRNWGFFSLGANELSFQVKLYEGTNVIQFVYQNGTGTATSAVQVGLRGASNAVFNNRTTTTDWSSTTAGVANNAQCTFNATVRPANGLTYTWTPPSVSNISWSPSTYLTATNIANPVAQNVVADVTYTVTATAASGCVSAPAQLVLEANPALAPGEASITPAVPSFCTGSNVTLTANPLGGGAPYTYAWTDPSSNPAGVAATQVVNVPGTWSVTITDNCGGTASASIVVTEYPVPVATVGSNSPVCSGNSIQLNASSTVPGSTFAWTGPNGFTSTDEDPVITNATLAMIGNYTVVASANGCSSAPTATLVQVNVTPTTPTVIPAAPVICAGGSVNLAASSTALTTLPYTTGGAITISPSGNAAPYPSAINVNGLPTSGVTVKQVLINGFSHTWPDDVDIALFSPANQNSIIFTDAIGGSGGVTGRNYVFEAGAPALPITGFPASGTYGVVNGGGFSGVGTPSAATSANLANFTGNVNGNWSLYVFDDVGGDAGTITSWGIVFEYNNVTYTWTGAGLNTNSGSTVTATPAATTTYTVTAENSGCSTSTNVTVTVNELPTTATVGGPQTICANTATLGLGGNTPTVGTGAWSIVSGGTGTFSNASDPNSTFTHTGGAGPIVLRWTITSLAPCAPSTADLTVTLNTTDTDGDGVIDCLDNCPNLFGQIGQACNAGPGFVIGTIDANCVCVGQQCTTDLILEFQTDANASQISWELRSTGTNILVQSGTGLPNNAIVTSNTCLPDGCYYLRVIDSGGDGIANGGYILRTSVGQQRIIDNRNNFNSGGVSAVINNGGFCLPLGTDKLIYTSCDKLDWVNNQFLVAAENALVSAQWQVGNQTDDGYQFWIFDPNGSYGYAKFRNHATSDGFGPASAIRACHMQINNWSPNQIPANVLMNAKVRSRVNGINSAWGPVCRFKIDPIRAACPLTKLMDIPGNQFFSCGVTRAWGSGAANRVVARTVDGATQYQFRWNNSELAAPVVRTTTTAVLQLNWTPALPNGTYQVQVRAFKNGQWCVTSLPWGDECNVTITGSPVGQNMNLQTTGSTSSAELTMFPNPNRGDLLTLSLSAVEEGVNTVSVDIYDLTGAMVSSRTIVVNDGMVYQVLELKEMASGLYMVNITAGDQRYTERLVISK
jgi:hypothetical protein